MKRRDRGSNVIYLDERLARSPEGRRRLVDIEARLRASDEGTRLQNLGESAVGAYMQAVHWYQWLFAALADGPSAPQEDCYVHLNPRENKDARIVALSETGEAVDARQALQFRTTYTTGSRITGVFDLAYATPEVPHNAETFLVPSDWQWRNWDEQAVQESHRRAQTLYGLSYNMVMELANAAADPVLNPPLAEKITRQWDDMPVAPPGIIPVIY